MTIKADVLDWSPVEKADAILLDAPCTATGTIRRHPDVLWAKTEDDVAALSKVQARLIDKAITFLADGGLLVYATCSLQPEEGERQIEAALARHPRLVRAPIDAAEIGGLAEAITGQGDLRTLPSMWAERGGLDGFFAARLRLNPA
jgi:16S rRNA (cytosine967-C5)-methyltransferase